jgi:hypothetical protein
MKSNSPRKIQKSSNLTARVIENFSVRRLIPFAVVLATCTVFLPSLSNDFVRWDDNETLLSNPRFRGLDWSNFTWMFTTFYMGHYQRLSWLSFTLDYFIWGLNPLGYHLINLLLHSATAFASYVVGRRFACAGVARAESTGILAVHFQRGVCRSLFRDSPAAC